MRSNETLLDRFLSSLVVYIPFKTYLRVVTALFSLAAQKQRSYSNFGVEHRMRNPEPLISLRLGSFRRQQLRYLFPACPCNYHCPPHRRFYSAQRR